MPQSHDHPEYLVDPVGDVYRALFEAMPLGATVTHFPVDDHRAGVLVAANAAASAAVGLDLAPLIDGPIDPTSITDDYDPDEADLITTMTYEVAVNGSTRRMADLEITSGPARGHYQTSIFPVGGRRAASVFQRIDNEYEAQRALDWAMQSLEAANDELARFASQAAHDLKNPIAGISGHAELLGMLVDDLPEAAQESVRRIIALSAMSATMIDDLLHYSARPTSVPSRSIDLAEVFLWVESMLADQLLAADAVVQVPEQLPLVFGNSAAIRQVLLNLVSNSIRYRRPNVPLELVITLVPRGDGLTELLVTDNGRGIAEGDRSVVFDWGRRGTQGAPTSGSGIGLAACRSVMSNLGGDIWVGEPPASGGTTMCLTFVAAD